MHGSPNLLERREASAEKQGQDHWLQWRSFLNEQRKKLRQTGAGYKESEVEVQP